MLPLILLGIALAVSATGFIRLVYFVSIGYAFSVAAMAAAGLLVHASGLTAVTIAHGVLLVAYGVRLGTYLVLRERRSAYAREAEDVRSMASKVGLARKLAIWVGVSILYVAMYSPALHSLRLVQVESAPLPWVGVAVMALGLALEAAADAQKSRFKAAHPNDFCNVGLYRLVRCPNYLGEIVFWTGNLVAGIWGMRLWWHWFAALAGYACIVLIMMGSTKRLEHKQDERYGGRHDYREYVRSVPVLLPFVPVYTLKNVRVYLE